MNTQQLIELDLDRLKRLNLGAVRVAAQSDLQATYEIKLSDSHAQGKVIEATGLVQALFGPRLLSSGSNSDNGYSCVTAKVCLQDAQLEINNPKTAAVLLAHSFSLRATTAEEDCKLDPNGKPRYFTIEEMRARGRQALKDAGVVSTGFISQDSLMEAYRRGLAAASDDDKKRALNYLLESLKRGASNPHRFMIDEPEKQGSKWQSAIRDWGKWHAHPDADFDEDDDHEVLSSESQKQLRTVIEHVEKMSPGIKIQPEVSEKNWIHFTTN